jgi:uncharacterized protein (TIGR00299 family) protein
MPLMTRIAYFQPFSGASGDMALGALVDAGLSLESLRSGLAALPLEGWRIESHREPRGPFETTRLRVIVENGAGDDRPAPHHAHHAHHEHSHGHGHAHHHPAGRSHGHAHAPGGHAHPHRGLPEILEIIARSGLPGPVRESAGAVFRRLGEAEARVHGVPVDKVHFHEVGAIDSIVDIAGTCLALHLLGVEEVRSAPVTVGTGFINVAHGRVPLPAPATLEILKGIPIEQRESGAELTTPTGAALLATLSRGFGPMPPMVVSSVGYGAGDDRPGPVPNALRVVLGETRTAGGGPFAGPSDSVIVLEASLDDMSPEWLGHLMERLFEAGALDVSFTPIVMKKSRPGHEVRVLAPLAAEGAVARMLFAESTTFGMRRTAAERIVLAREHRPVETPGGTVRVKVGMLAGEVLTASPEYEDLRAAARAAGRPLKEMHDLVMRLFAGSSGKNAR